MTQENDLIPSRNNPISFSPDRTIITQKDSGDIINCRIKTVINQQIDSIMAELKVSVDAIADS